MNIGDDNNKAYDYHTPDIHTTMSVGRKNWKDRLWASPEVINTGLKLGTNIATALDNKKKARWLPKM